MHVKSKTNGIWRFDPCGDCRVYGTWKRDRDEYIVFAGSSGIFVGLLFVSSVFVQGRPFIWQQFY